MQDLHDLSLLLERQVPLLLLESHEEARALEMLTRLAIRRGLALQQWTLSDGLRRLGFGEDVAAADSTQPTDALRIVREREQGGLFVFCDLHPFLEEPLVVRLLKDIALQHERYGKTVVLLSHRLQAPPELQRLAVSFSLQLPDDSQLLALVKEEAQRYAKLSGRKVRSDNDTLQQLVANLKGLTFSDARRLVRGAIVDDGAITQDDVPAVSRAKMALLDMDGVMSFEYDTARFSDVAGLEVMKTWLAQRQKAFMTAERKLRPRGMLLFGVQGSGKSLAAKAVAGSWGLPLLRLDFGTLYNKFFGETERNLREALKLAETMSPCVVWIDEIEKGLGQDSNDAGVSQRILGTLLTWLAEHDAQVFVVATANNIHALPPELLRKGRLDELFFVDLPKTEIRAEILRLHMQKRGLDPQRFELTTLAENSEGFSGAELEQAVVSAWHAASSDHSGPGLSTDTLLQEIRRTRPLSVVMAEPMQALRQWAASRAVAAD
ncbi:MAG: AAA family ATPase [Saccharospirillaceae bacterium]|nr:AAA family ATPase [Saccharospirillaceae bacterium]MCD8529771.1 AAA family ATPase [Saccharospirillaceae bacterium]